MTIKMTSWYYILANLEFVIRGWFWIKESTVIWYTRQNIKYLQYINVYNYFDALIDWH